MFCELQNTVINNGKSWLGQDQMTKYVQMFSSGLVGVAM